jgi:lipoprotein-releasing system permease protein
MNFSLYIAKKLYSSGNGNKRASLPAIRIAIFGVAVGLAVMILSVAVVFGFKDEISSKVIGFGSHLTIYNTAPAEIGESRPIIVDDELVKGIEKIPDVEHVQYYSMKSGILKTTDQFAGITLKGINSTYSTDFVSSHIIEGQLPDYSKKGTENEIVISKSIANDLRLKVGDKLFAYFFENGLRARRFKVAAIYRTDLSQFDKVLVFANDKTVRNLCKWDDKYAYGVEITVKDFSKLNETSFHIAKFISKYNIEHNTSYVSFTVKELYPQIFDWLNLLNINIWVILILMLAVAGVTIVSGLLILILERTSTIALLKTLGATNTLVRKVFINLAVIILLKGMVAGNVLGLLLAFLQKEFNIVHLNPESYYIDSVPVEFDLTAIILINIVTFIVSTLALVLPSYLVARIHPSKVLRFE